jgi:hypothetical protein
MGLQDKLNAHKEGFKAKAPKEAQAIMQRATAEISRSGILDRAIAVGDAAPAFELENTEGHRIRLGDLIARGPLVLSFYRGKW